MLHSVRRIHHQLQITFSQVLLGEDYVSTSEAARFPRVHQSTVARWLSRMESPGLRVGQHWHIRRDKLASKQKCQDEKEIKDES